MVTIDTSTTTSALRYCSSRHIDRTSTGRVWAAFITASSGADLEFWYSDDDGATWTQNTSATISSVGSSVAGFSFFIDVDDHAHIVYDTGGASTYRRMASIGTATSWGTAFTVDGTHDERFDIVAFRDGASWIAAVAASNGTSSEVYIVEDVDGTPSIAQTINISTFTYPSLDFHHTGDGKTIAGSAPHIYVSGVDGGGDLKYAKLTYSAGSTSSIAHVATASNTGGGDTTVDVPIPAGGSSGDIMVAYITVRGDIQETPTAPAGWTQIRSEDPGTGSGNDVVLRAYWKEHSGSESSPQQWTYTGNAPWVAACSIYSGVDTTSPINNDSGGTDITNDDDIDAPGHTNTSDDCMVVWIGAQNTSSSATVSPPSGFTERMDDQRLTAFLMASADKIQASAGATGTPIRGISSVTGNSDAAILISLEPALTGSTWTEGTNRTLDTSGTKDNAQSLIFDGTRVVVAYAESSTVYIAERDEADTTTTLRTPTALSDSTVINLSVTYDSDENIHLWAVGNTSEDLKRIVYERGTDTWDGSWTTVLTGSVIADSLTLKRGYSDETIDAVFLEGTNPFDVTYESLGLNAPPTAPTVTAPADNVTTPLTEGVTFSWTHNDPESDAQTGYALKRRVVTLGDGIEYAAEEWWNETSWLSTETVNATATSSEAVSAWPADYDTYQYAIATEDAGSDTLGPYSAWRTLNPWEWWNGSAWVVMTESFVASATDGVTIASADSDLDGESYDWTVATKDAEVAGPYATTANFIVFSFERWGAIHI